MLVAVADERSSVSCHTQVPLETQNSLRMQQKPQLNRIVWVWSEAFESGSLLDNIQAWDSL